MNMKKPVAEEVYFPSPSTAILKMFPHMTEVKHPVRMRNTALIGISVKILSPKETTRSEGVNIAIMTRIIVSNVANESMSWLAKRDPK